MPSRLSSEVIATANTTHDRHPDREICLDRAPGQGLCKLGLARAGRDGTRFLLWGDSHAEMLAAWIGQSARAAGRSGTFAGQIGCTPVASLRKTAGNGTCAGFTASVWSWLAKHREVELVILAARWPRLVEGTPYRGESGTGIVFEWVGDPARRPAGTDNAALIEAGLAETVDRLVAEGRRVVLIGPVPEVGRHVPLDTARRRLMGLPLAADVTQAEFAARAGRSEAILRRVAARSPQVRYLPLSDLFCATGRCRTLGPDGLPLYVDDDHLRATTARTLLRPRLDTIWTGQAP
ncbi:MAG: SGNH hydrolase domain-containing protein [Erythrobacter sp.]